MADLSCFCRWEASWSGQCEGLHPEIAQADVLFEAKDEGFLTIVDASEDS